MSKYHLRSEPITVSRDNMREAFRLDKWWRPVEYIAGELEDNRDGTVTDRATGLMWQQSGADKYLKHDEAKTYIEELNRDRFAGYNDWRLPTMEELLSLLEPTRGSDALFIDPVFDSKQRWCWSVDRGPSGSAWAVHFYWGGVNWVSLMYNHPHPNVRAVRAC
jgi:hypothetical protein